MTQHRRLLDRRGMAAIAALAAGAGAALAFPPFGVLPGLLGYGLLLSVFDAADPDRPLRSAFWRGWLAGAVFFLISTWWVAEAFFVDPEKHGWQAPFAVAGMAGGLGLFWGLAGVGYRLIRPNGGVRLLAFAGVFCLVEWLRGHVLTGFPWDLAGESWRAGSAPSQAASLVGAYGLSWLTLIASAAPALALDRDSGRRSRLIALGVSLLVFGTLYGYGRYRLASAAPASVHGPIVRVVQADVAESATYSEAQFQDILQTYIALTRQPAAKRPDIIVWPEGAIPDSLDDYLAPTAWTSGAIAAALSPGQTLMLGGYRTTGPASAPRYYNSMLALRARDGELQISATYDKHRLVPFGEYLPFSRLLKPIGFDKLVQVGEGFTPGPPPAPISPAGAPRVQPLICYESLFPGFTRDGAGHGRAAWIVNVSDDAWFGRSYGPIQHLNLASYRAIEEGLPIVRATPTGVSAVIDAYGRILPGARLDHGARGVIDRTLPPALRNTAFARFGELGFSLMVVISVLAAIIRRMTLRHIDVEA
jgi:apolipoprotein N-acyltransferase